MITALTTLIEEWAIERGLHTANPDKQMLKLAEEFGELAQGMAKKNPDQIEDSIGDMYVVMTILSMQLGLDIEDCVLGAYNEIKDRRGKMINGVFVKEADLKDGVKTDDGWYCEASPSLRCDYLHFVDGYNEDCCIYCGEPYERK